MECEYRWVQYGIHYIKNPMTGRWEALGKLGIMSNQPGDNCAEREGDKDRNIHKDVQDDS